MNSNLKHLPYKLLKNCQLFQIIIIFIILFSKIHSYSIINIKTNTNSIHDIRIKKVFNNTSRLKADYQRHSFWGNIQ